MAIKASDLSNFMTAANGFVDALKTLNINDPVSVVGFQNSITSLELATAPLLNGSPVFGTLANGLGIINTMNSVKTDLAAYRRV